MARRKTVTKDDWQNFCSMLCHIGNISTAKGKKKKEEEEEEEEKEEEEEILGFIHV